MQGPLQSSLYALTLWQKQQSVARERPPRVRGVGRQGAYPGANFPQCRVAGHPRPNRPTSGKYHEPTSLSVRLTQTRNLRPAPHVLRRPTEAGLSPSCVRPAQPTRTTDGRYRRTVVWPRDHCERGLHYL